MKYKFLLIALISFIYVISVNAQIGVNATGGVYFPIGELAKSYNTGYGGDIAFIYKFNPSFELSLVGGVSAYEADQDELEKRLLEDLGDIGEGINIEAEFNVEAPLKLYPLVLNFTYMYGKKKFKPYFFFEGGIFFYDLTYTGYIKIINGPTIDLPESIEKRSSTTLSLGGGFLSSLSKKLFLNVRGKWSIMNNINLVEADENEELRGVEKTVQTISLSAGLSYYF